MPLLVRKKLVSADCACAGALAIADIAATAKHAGKMIRTKLFIEILPVVFWFVVINTSRQPLFRCRKTRSKADHPAKEKGAAERTAAPSSSCRGDQLVCWIAESSQSAPRRRAKVHTSVASVGVSLPETRRPVVRSVVLSTSENRIATLPPRHCQPHHDDDQADLQQQADDRRQAAEAGEQTAAGQHAEQAGAKEAHGETAEHAPHHSGPVEEAALVGRAGSRRGAHSGAARLGEGTVHGLRRARRRGGARGRRKGSRSPRTGTAATADAGVSLRDRDRQRERHGQDNGQCPNNSARALREIHVFFLNPQDGETPLRWAQMPKSEAIIGNRGCGPQSRGCDDLAGS